MASSRYGAQVDGLIDRWTVLENEHDQQHPDRSQCGGVGRCSMMMAGHTLEEQIIDALTEWRQSRG